MKTFRKFIVKHFALSYRIELFRVRYVGLRATRIIFPLFVLTALLQMNGIFLGWFLLIPSLYFGFVYFMFFPVKWEELDSYQKYLYGQINHKDLTLNQNREFIKIRKIYENN